MSRKFRVGRWVAGILIVLGAILLTGSGTFLADGAMQEPALYGCLGLIIAALVVVFVCCRCPHCGHVVFRNLFGAKRCPDCGRPLWDQRNTPPSTAIKPPSVRHRKRK